MKRILISVAVLALSSVSLIAKEQVTLPIKSVLLYPDRAQITRSASISLTQGKHQIQIAGVSPNLSSESLRASCSKGCTIIEVSSRLDRFTETVRPRVQALEKKMRVAQEKRESIQNSISRHSHVLSFAVQLGAAASKIIGEESVRNGETSRWSKAFQFISEEKASRKKLIQKLEDDRRKIDLEIAAIQKELDATRGEGEKSARTVEVRLGMEKGGQAELQVDYTITGASWSVSYGMLLGADNSVEVEMFGQVIQSTGEDWNNVKVGFSTANPQRGLARPKIRPVRLRVVDRRPQPGYAREEREATTRTEAVESSGEEQTGGVTEIDAGGTALIFRVPDPQTIESSRQPQKVPMAHFTLKPSEIVYRVVPAQARQALLAVKMKNDRAFPLIAGPVDLFRAGKFSGKTRIPYVPGNTDFTVGFAEERGIAVERSVLKNRESAGLIGSGLSLTREIRFDVENRTSNEASVRIFEVLPVSEMEEVKISITDNGGFAEENKGSGIYSKLIKIAAGSKQTLKIKYSVKAPEDFPEGLIDR